MNCNVRLRQVDIKAEHFERQVQKLEGEVQSWELKYEVRIIIQPPSHRPEVSVQTAREETNKLKKELAELEASLGGL